ncbi:fructosamine kinase [Pukyongia salina]|uniref:Fructosamine kinase n=1 Tax=Pukyongia salina TaxID=2094025 RepID=A0A2S0HUD4_9FLAO|nr:fructosamine kinase family protein [Pukyongia salina]AVI50226.1 fructosamine kinase [Pukyongia salina]
MESLLHSIAALNSFNLQSYQPMAGGDINDVFLLRTNNGDLVVKLNLNDKYPSMFDTEKAGLELLASTETFRIPKIIACGIEEHHAYLLMEYIDGGAKKKSFWEEFGGRLANLHQNSADLYGWKYNNYIGSLFQANSFYNLASQFYIENRLRPQIGLARRQGYLEKDLTNFFKNIADIIPQEAPALIHGDLWSGNYLIDNTGAPVLIDPSVSYSHREMDLAMMQLFGGFPAEVFKVYQEEFPLLPDWEERIALWQLYYLLVHLNIFGGGYLARVETIISRYS